MRTSDVATIVGFGAVTWLVPFLAAVLLMDRSGTPRIPVDLFKSLMVVVGAAVGAWCLIRVRRSPKNVRRPGWQIGGAWFAINVALDIAILLPLTDMPLDDYVMQIGVRYLTIPIMAVAIDVAGAASAGSADTA